MELSSFIQTLLTEGKVSVIGKLICFNAEDTQATKKILQQYYQEDQKEMPFIAPGYSEEAAIWAAEYFYKAVQVTVIRDAGEETVREKLFAYKEAISHEAIYSADLILRYLPSLFNLAKGLAPMDILVQILNEAALLWPFSSVGIELNKQPNDEMIFSHPSLRLTYLDRIIQHKAKQRIASKNVIDGIHEIAGNHLSFFWPDFERINK
ncbi:MAG TPA: hypothetical protein VKT28_00585 [Puia sp.]|nr:hypothetical protein [Puia sp.]